MGICWCTERSYRQITKTDSGRRLAGGRSTKEGLYDQCLGISLNESGYGELIDPFDASATEKKNDPDSPGSGITFPMTRWVMRAVRFASQ